MSVNYREWIYELQDEYNKKCKDKDRRLTSL